MCPTDPTTPILYCFVSASWGGREGECVYSGGGSAVCVERRLYVVRVDPYS